MSDEIRNKVDIAKEYYTRVYRVYLSPEKTNRRLEPFGTKLKDDLYHIDSFTVVVGRFAEGGEKAVLTLSTKIEQDYPIDKLVDDLFKKVNLNYAPIYSLEEFLAQLEAAKKT